MGVSGSFCRGRDGVHCCEADVSTVTLWELKTLLEGQCLRVRETPAVFVTFDELKLKDGGAFKFSPEKFSLKGLEVECTIQVKGTATSISSLAARKGGSAMLGSIGINHNSRVAAREALKKPFRGRSCDCSLSQLGIGAWEFLHVERSLRLHLTVDLHKAFDQDVVNVHVREVHTDLGLVEAVLSVDAARLLAERAISQKVTKATTSMANKHLNRMYETIDGALSPASGLYASLDATLTPSSAADDSPGSSTGAPRGDSPRRRARGAA